MRAPLRFASPLSPPPGGIIASNMLIPARIVASLAGAEGGPVPLFARAIGAAPDDAKWGGSPEALLQVL